MRTARTTTPGTRRVSTAALCGTAAFAIIGGSMLSATAANAATYRCVTTTGSTMLVDGTSAGTGLLNLGSTSGLVGVATGPSGVSVGLLSCTATANLGVTGATAVATLAPSAPSAPAAPAAPTAPGAPASTTPASTAPASTTPTGSAPAASTPPAGSLADIKVRANATTVYPAKDGYKDKVTFSVRGLTAADRGVKVTGKAVLKKGTRIVKTWRIDEATSTLSWNGRIGTKVRPGLYRLTVTARSADGMKKTTTMKVHVSAKHLISRTLTVKSMVSGSDTTAKAPAEVVKALKLGQAYVQVRTVARVHGPAELVFSNGGVRAAIPLVNGVYTTKQLPVPPGFAAVRLTHNWKKGDAKLVSLRAIWSYKELV